MDGNRNGINLLFRFADKMGKDRVRAHAAEAAFFLIMSFFPILMLLLALVQYTPLQQEQVIQTMAEILPSAVAGYFEPVVSSLFHQSTALVSGTAIAALWAAGKGIIGLSDGLNSIFRCEDEKNYVIVRIRAACYALVLVLALVISLAILVFGYGIQEYLKEEFPVLQRYADAMATLPLTLAMVVLVFLFCILYAYLPGRRMRFLRQLPGAVFAAVSWAVFSYGFSLYLDFVSNMSLIYGSLTTLVVVMLWLYGCMYLLFIGAEINHYLAHPELF